ncbi:hypothetical protein MJD09_20155 [bacterium]|nr:hypothetical protein [bacterium]
MKRLIVGLTKQDSNKALEPWGEHEITVETRNWCFGPLRLWCKRLGDELWLAFDYAKDEVAPTVPEAKIPESIIEWSRWVLKDESNIRFTPVFPDRTVVVKPEYPFWLLQGAQARIYVRVPLWLRIESVGGLPQAITEVPCVILSKTWFGTPTDGELCYWISTSARREMRPDPDRPFLAMTPLQIRNRSEDDLRVEKWALRVDRLSIFKHDQQLWSDEMRIEYLGKQEVSQIKMSGKPPPQAASAKLLSQPRNVSNRGFAAKTFSTLRDLSDWI